MVKGLLGKLKTGFVGLALIGVSYFNAKAQENYIQRNTTTHYIIKEIQKESPYIELKTLDGIIDESKKIVNENYKGDPYNTEEAKNLMEKLSKIIENYPELTNNDETCYRKSLTHLAMGEANNLPIDIKIAPRHMFLMWNPDSTDKGDFNWDPNWLSSKGFMDYYTELFFGWGLMLTKDKLNELGFFRSLNKNELLSKAYQQESGKLFDKDFYDEALEYIDKSIKMTPNFPEAYFVKGSFLQRLGEKKCGKDPKEVKNNLECQKYFKEACDNYAISLEGNIGTNNYIQSFLGDCFYYLGEYKKAENYFTQSIGNGKNIHALKMRAKLYLETNQKEKAKKDIYSCLNMYKDISKKVYENSGHNWIGFDDKPLYIYTEFKEREEPNWKNDWKGSISYNLKKIEKPNWKESESSCKNLDYANSGWRLPSIEELDLIYQNKKEIPLTNMGKMWSSTESEQNEGWVKNMDNGEKEKVEKYKISYYQNNQLKYFSYLCVKNFELKISESSELNHAIREFELEELIKEAFY